MTLRFMDGFDYYATDAEVGLKYDAWAGAGFYVNMLPSGGRRGGGCIQFYSQGGYARKTFEDQTKWIMGFALKMEVMPTSTTQCIRFIDSAGDTQCTLAISTSGALMAYRGTTSLLATSAMSLLANAWQYVEVEAVIHDTTGSFKVRVDEVEVINVTNVDTKNNTPVGARTIQFGGGGSAVNFDYDDLYILDGLGTTNNAFLGDVRVDALLPNGAGAHTDFTPVGGANNWDNVNDAAMDSDTTYNTSATVGATDTFTFSDLAAVSGTIYGVQANLMARKDDAGTGSMKPIVRLNSTDYEGTELTMSDSYINKITVFEQNPDTVAAWTQADINGAEFGYRVAS